MGEDVVPGFEPAWSADRFKVPSSGFRSFLQMSPQGTSEAEGWFKVPSSRFKVPGLFYSLRQLTEDAAGRGVISSSGFRVQSLKFFVNEGKIKCLLRRREKES